MAQKPMPSMERPPSELDYQPISGVAVAAIVVSGLYVITATIVAIIALYTRRPVLAIEWVIPAFAGLALAIAARLHINRSEGARSGMGLAATAWWLSVLGGAAFGAYLAASYSVLSRDARDTSAAWFETLKDGKVYRAYLDTVDPTRRANIDPDNVQAMIANFPKMPPFLNSELVRFFRRNGKDVQVEWLGLGKYEQVSTGFQVESKSLLKSPEGTFEINLILARVEGENVRGGREWYVERPDVLTAKQLTTYGRLVSELQEESQQFCKLWAEKVSTNQRMAAYLDTLPAAERSALNGALQTSCRDAKMLVAGAMLAPYAPAGNGLKPKVNPFDKNAVLEDLLKRNFLQYEGLLTEEKKKQLIDTWKLGSFYVAGGNRAVLNAETAPSLAVTGQGVVCSFPVELQLPGVPVGFTKARVIAVSNNPELVKELEELKSKGAANAGQADTRSEALLAARPPREWQIVRIETDLEKLSSARPGPPGAPQ